MDEVTKFKGRQTVTIHGLGTIEYMDRKDNKYVYLLETKLDDNGVENFLNRDDCQYALLKKINDGMYYVTCD
jgi:hypothetical protein